MDFSSPRACWLGVAVLAVAVTLVGAPSAVAGGDQPTRNPTKGPPGPWTGDDADDAPYRPSSTRRCEPPESGDAGPGVVLGLYARDADCREALGLLGAYRTCLASGSRPANACYDRVRRRCVQPQFLGRCRTYDDFYYRTVNGYECVERRLGAIGSRYDANVSCSLDDRRIDHSYTLILTDAVSVGTEPDLRSAWANPRLRKITLTNDIVLRACRTGDPIRESAGPVLLDGAGHTLRQGCFEKRLLRQDGTGYVELKNVTLTRGGSDGPGGAVTTRGEITVIDSTVKQNLAEEPGGGIMSQRRATIIRSIVTGNLANDDGGGVYARRGGIQVYDSIISGNLVDGSGGALGSTGDILVVRSHLDGNTTDGDGGAIYTDEAGDVTVIDSTVSGNDADGPGGAIFTLDGDVTVVNSTLNGNRADDRGGAISGEAAVVVVNSTISRNIAVAHVGGGVWSRGDMYVGNSTVSNNYAEGKGGGLHAAGVLTLVNSTVSDNIGPVGANVGAGARLRVFGSVIGPAKVNNNGGQTQPTSINCDAPVTTSLGYNVLSDSSCGFERATDTLTAASATEPLSPFSGAREVRMPFEAGPAVDRVPPDRCLSTPLPASISGEQHLRGRVGNWRSLMSADQRGVQRPQGAACDSGAVERGQ